MKKRMPILALSISLLALASCNINFSLKKTWQNLSEEDAQSLSELHLMTLDKDPSAFRELLHPQLAALMDDKALQTIIQGAQFHDPQNILVTSVKNGIKYNERDGYSATEVKGAFSCEYNHDDKADFYFTFVYNSQKEIWEVIIFSIEACIAPSQ